MGQYFNVSATHKEDHVVLEVSFGLPGNNSEIIKSALEDLEKLDLKGGPLLKIDGPCTLPAAFAIADKVKHLFAAVAVFDPKMSGFVVAISSGSGFNPGDLIQ